jgi:hypothetical protein
VKQELGISKGNDEEKSVLANDQFDEAGHHDDDIAEENGNDYGKEIYDE